MSMIADTALVLIDVQGKLADVVHDHEVLHTNTEKIVQCMRKLGVPILVTEQNPTRMGPTIARLSQHLEGVDPIPKMAFSCCGCPAFVQALKGLGRKRLVLCGIETHVCVYQTAIDLLADGFVVDIAADCVSSRTTVNRDAGLARIQAAGGGLTSTEMLTLELLKTAEHPAFRDILKIIR